MVVWSVDGLHCDSQKNSLTEPLKWVSDSCSMFRFFQPCSMGFVLSCRFQFAISLIFVWIASFRFDVGHSSKIWIVLCSISRAVLAHTLRSKNFENEFRLLYTQHIQRSIIAFVHHWAVWCSKFGHRYIQSSVRRRRGHRELAIYLWPKVRYQTHLIPLRRCISLPITHPIVHSLSFRRRIFAISFVCSMPKQIQK